MTQEEARYAMLHDQYIAMAEDAERDARLAEEEAER